MDETLKPSQAVWAFQPDLLLIRNAVWAEVALASPAMDRVVLKVVGTDGVRTLVVAPGSAVYATEAEALRAQLLWLDGRVATIKAEMERVIDRIEATLKGEAG